MDNHQILKRRPQEILSYIQKCITENGFPPSVREIGQAVGLKSSSTVHTYLLQLEEAGYIRRDSTKTRAIFLNQPPPSKYQFDADSVSLPLIGSVAAGTPIFAEQNIEAYMPVATDLIGSGNHFILQVQGDSMIEAGIHAGDYLIVREQADAQNGEIVVALMGDEATVKHYYKQADQIELRPANPAYASIFTREAQIAGKVSGLMRRI